MRGHLLHGLQEFGTGGAWHHQIGQHDLDPMATNQLEGALGIGSGEHPHPLLGERFLEGLEVARFVIDDQHGDLSDVDERG